MYERGEKCREKEISHERERERVKKVERVGRGEGRDGVK